MKKTTASGLTKTTLNNMFISTKLCIPPMKAQLLPRESLLERLSRGRDRRLIVVSGMAGSGKTSLVCQWIARDDLTVAWYSLDQTDNDGDLFFRYFLTALAGVDERLARMIEPFLQSHKVISGTEFVPLAVRLFVDLDRDIHVVLDDYHLVQSPEIHRVLTSLLEYMPPRMHLVIVSRYTIPIPMGHFRIRNQMVEIAPSDIYFTEAETERFVKEIMQVALSHDEMRELRRHTEGWVGGLQLFGLSLKSGGTVVNKNDMLGRLGQETTAYLIEEIVNAQPEKVKNFIYDTALLERFSDELCEEVTGLSDVAEILDHLHRNNLYLIALDVKGTWYRYHHLLSEAVRKSVRTASPATFREVQRKAARWFANNGYLEDALRHAFVSGDKELTADLLEDSLPLFYEYYDVPSGVRWIAKLPRSVLIKRALLRLHECLLKIDSLHFSALEEIFREIEAEGEDIFKRYHGFKKMLCDDLVTYFRYVLRYFLRDPAHADVERLNEAVGLISRGNRVFAVYIKLAVAWSHFIMGDLALAGETLEETSGLLLTCESVWARMLWTRLATDVERYRGRLIRSEAVLRESSEFLDEKGFSESPMRFILSMSWARIFYLRNDLDTALSHLAIALDYAEQMKMASDIVQANGLLAFIYLAQGDEERTQLCTRKMELAARATGSRNMVAVVEAMVARIAMGRGNLDFVDTWVEGRRLSMDDPFSILFVMECLDYCEYYYRRGRHQEGRAMLEQLRERCTARGMWEQILDIDLLYSATLYALSERDKAHRTMQRALVFSEAEGYVRPLVERGTFILPILKDLAARKSHRAVPWLYHIIGQCRSGREGVHATISGMKKRHPDLTHREMEILKLITVGYQNKEIADRTCVSLDTIKTHTKHIFQKLDVKTRIQAIRRAEDLKLFKTT